MIDKLFRFVEFIISIIADAFKKLVGAMLILFLVILVTLTTFIMVLVRLLG